MDTTNWTKLFRFALRRDRLYLTLWLVGLVVLGTFFVPVFPSMAGTAAEMATLGEMMANPAMVAMCGPKYGDEYTLGIMYGQLMLVWVGLAFAAFGILLVIRHTRADEEAGRLEVLGSLPVGRSANLIAVTLLAVLANLVSGLLIGLIMPVFGVATIDLAGSLVMGLAFGACGLAFSAVTLVIVQVAATSRGATGLSMALMGASYLVRAGGDVSAPSASLTVPLGLIEQTEPFYSNSLWPIAVMLAGSAVLAVVAFLLNRARDLGLGLLPQRPGPAHAPRSLSGEWGLTWRLTRGTLIGWGITVFVVAASYGSIMGDMDSFLNSSEMYQQVMQVTPGQANMTPAVVATLMQIMAIVGAIPVVLAVHRLASEEKKSRLDQVLGTAASRTRLYAGHALIAGVAGLALQVLSGIGFGAVAHSVMATDPVSVGLVLKVALSSLPALWVFGGLGLCLVGWAKGATPVTWVYLAVSFLLVYLGGTLNIPAWVPKLSPFGLLPRYPVDAFSAPTWLALVAVALALGALGCLGYRRRDVTN